MKNKLSDLNDHLFAQLERLSDESLTAQEIEREASRGDAIVAVADQIIRNASLQVQVANMVAEKGSIRPLLPSIACSPEAPQPKLVEKAK
jgi:hypothetical protein